MQTTHKTKTFQNFTLTYKTIPMISPSFIVNVLLSCVLSCCLCKPGLCNSTEAKIFEYFSQRIKGEACCTMCGCLLQVSSDHSPAGPISANRCQQCSTFYFFIFFRQFIMKQTPEVLLTEALKPRVSFNM